MMNEVAVEKRMANIILVVVIMSWHIMLFLLSPVLPSSRSYSLSFLRFLAHIVVRTLSL